MSYDHTENIIKYAKDCEEYLKNGGERPWTKWEIFFRGESSDLYYHPVWFSSTGYRRKSDKPKVIKVGEFEIPAPYRGDMKKCDEYFYISPRGHVCSGIWYDGGDHEKRRNFGI